MKRREFLALLGSAMLAQPLTAQARQTEGADVGKHYRSLPRNEPRFGVT